MKRYCTKKAFDVNFLILLENDNKIVATVRPNERILFKKIKINKKCLQLIPGAGE